MDEFQLTDYLYVLKYRKKYFIAVALAVFLLSLTYALRWSNYRATATVEVAPADISSGTVTPLGSNANDRNEALADLRISHLQQKVLSTGSLVEIIAKFDLYPGPRKYTPIATIAEGMRKKIALELVSTTLANPASQGAAGLSAIAFNLSFDYSSPLLAQQVTNELVSRFLDEDLKTRRREAEETSAFLAVQIKALETSMQEQEKKIAEFRAANKGTEPQSLQFNQQVAQSIQVNIEGINAQVTANEGTQGSLRAQLASVDPYSRLLSEGQVLTTPSVQLKALKSQYTTLSAQYGPTHPDVLKLRHQIAALEKQVGKTGATQMDEGALKAKIDDVRTNLAAARKTYGPDHPDVVSLQRQLTKLEGDLIELQNNPLAKDNIKSDADNPAYLQIVEELKSAQEQHKSLMAEKDALMGQQAKFQDAVLANPVAEQKLAELSRDYDNAQLRYRELKEKKMAADMSETIEQDRSGQRLVVLDPPELPLHTQPSRSVFAVGGLLLSIACGLVSVALAQMVSQSVVGPRHLESITGLHPLVTIPHLYIPEEAEQQDQKRVRAVVSAVIFIIIAIIAFSYLVMPLDVLWSVLGQRLGFL